MPSLILADVELKPTLIQPVQSPVAKLQPLTVPVLNGRPEHGESLPTEAHCLAHLALLESFVSLKVQVEKLAKEQGMTAEAGWARYLKKSVEKFAHWISSQKLSADGGDRSTVLPQLDVLMVWHAFMLNPLKYTKFERVTNLQLLRHGIDWDLINQSIDLVSCNTNNSAAILETLMNAEDQPTSNAEHFQFTTSTGPASFPFNLEAAVQRQFSFSLKMAQFAWHRSPYATGTMRRSIDRYINFFSLVSLGPGLSVVPTLDVDLIWHTHQLNPEEYRVYSASITGGRVVNHDDTIGESVLAPGFAATSALFKTTFGDDYGLCFCWACEAGRSRCVVNLVEIERLVRDENSRREDAGLTVDLNLAMPACDECGLHPARGCRRPGGCPADGRCSSCGNDPCTCGSGGGGGSCSSCSSKCNTNCKSSCNSNCNSSCGSGCGGG